MGCSDRDDASELGCFSLSLAITWVFDRLNAEIELDEFRVKVKTSLFVNVLASFFFAPSLAIWTVRP